MDIGNRTTGQSQLFSVLSSNESTGFIAVPDNGERHCEYPSKRHSRFHNAEPLMRTNKSTDIQSVEKLCIPSSFNSSSLSDGPYKCQVGCGRQNQRIVGDIEECKEHTKFYQINTAGISRVLIDSPNTLLPHRDSNCKESVTTSTDVSSHSQYQGQSFQRIKPDENSQCSCQQSKYSSEESSSCCGSPHRRETEDDQQKHLVHRSNCGYSRHTVSHCGCEKLAAGDRRKLRETNALTRAQRYSLQNISEEVVDNDVRKYEERRREVIRSQSKRSLVSTTLSKLKSWLPLLNREKEEIEQEKPMNSTVHKAERKELHYDMTGFGTKCDRRHEQRRSSDRGYTRRFRLAEEDKAVDNFLPINNEKDDRKPIRCMVVHDTGGLDIEVQCEDDMYALQCTVTGKRRKYFHPEKISSSKTLPGEFPERNDSGNERVDEMSLSPVGSGHLKRCRLSSGLDVPIKPANESKLTHQLVNATVQPVSIPGLGKPGNENQGHNSKTINWASQATRLAVSNPKPTNRKRPIPVWYYFGDVHNKIRHGWGTLVNDKRILFDGEWTMDACLGRYLIYHEFSVEIGRTTLAGDHGVLIVADNDCTVVPYAGQYPRYPLLTSSDSSSTSLSLSPYLDGTVESSYRAFMGPSHSRRQSWGRRNKPSSGRHSAAVFRWSRSLSSRDSPLMSPTVETASGQNSGRSAASQSPNNALRSKISPRSPLVVFKECDINSSTNVLRNFKYVPESPTLNPGTNISLRGPFVRGSKRFINHRHYTSNQFSSSCHGDSDRDYNSSNATDVSGRSPSSDSDSAELLNYGSSIKWNNGSSKGTLRRGATLDTDDFRVTRREKVRESSQGSSDHGKRNTRNQAGGRSSFDNWNCCYSDSASKDSIRARSRPSFFKAASQAPGLLRASNCSNWTTNQTYLFLEMIGCANEAVTFKRKGICGADLLQITDRRLKTDFGLGGSSLSVLHQRRFLLAVFRFLHSCHDKADYLRPASHRRFYRPHCGRNGQRVIKQDDLVLGKTIGRGGYAVVCLGLYKGERVATKVFSSAVGQSIVKAASPKMVEPSLKKIDSEQMDSGYVPRIRRWNSSLSNAKCSIRKQNEHKTTTPCQKNCKGTAVVDVRVSETIGSGLNRELASSDNCKCKENKENKNTNGASCCNPKADEKPSAALKRVARNNTIESISTVDGNQTSKHSKRTSIDDDRQVSREYLSFPNNLTAGSPVSIELCLESAKCVGCSCGTPSTTDCSGELVINGPPIIQINNRNINPTSLPNPNSCCSCDGCPLHSPHHGPVGLSTPMTSCPSLTLSSHSLDYCQPVSSDFLKQSSGDGKTRRNAGDVIQRRYCPPITVKQFPSRSVKYLLMKRSIEFPPSLQSCNKRSIQRIQPKHKRISMKRSYGSRQKMCRQSKLPRVPCRQLIWFRNLSERSSWIGYRCKKRLQYCKKLGHLRCHNSGGYSLIFVRKTFNLATSNLSLYYSMNPTSYQQRQNIINQNNAALQRSQHIGSGAKQSVPQPPSFSSFCVCAYADCVQRDAFRQLPVAVKNCNFEAQILSHLQSHPFIIKFHGVVKINSAAVGLVLEYCHRGCLDDIIHRPRTRHEYLQWKPISRPDILRFFEEIAVGMSYVHRRRILHRDLKLSNILVDESGHIRIADFGIATPFSPMDSPSSLAMYGNVYYAAPEVLRGEGFYPQSDVWSYGVTLWEALTGDEAFEGMCSGRAFAEIAAGSLTLPIPTDVPDSLQLILRSILAPDWRNRPGFETIAKDLRKLGSATKAAVVSEVELFFGL